MDQESLQRPEMYALSEQHFRQTLSRALSKNILFETILLLKLFILSQCFLYV